MNKRGQLSIFIIIAIILVAVILIVFFPRIKTVFTPSSVDVQLQNCIEDRYDEAVELVSNQGGSISPENTYAYQGNNVEYLCYTNKDFQTCVMQRALLKEHVEGEILSYIEDDTRACIGEMRNQLEEAGYEVSGGGSGISLQILPHYIDIVADGISARGEDGQQYKKLTASYRSELYELLMIATSILNFETKFGDSEIQVYMTYYPYIKVEKLKQSDGTKIYILTNTKTRDKFMFATRSIAWPAGYDLT